MRGTCQATSLGPEQGPVKLVRKRSFPFQRTSPPGSLSRPHQDANFEDSEHSVAGFAGTLTPRPPSPARTHTRPGEGGTRDTEQRSAEVLCAHKAGANTVADTKIPPLPTAEHGLGWKLANGRNPTVLIREVPPL
jgi:hypothetical protein